MNYFRQNREQLLRVFLFVGLGAFALVFLASAATAQTTIFKANNTTALETTAAWTNSTAGAGGNPLGVNAGYIGTIDSTVAAGTAPSLTLGGTMTIGGLKILNPGAAVTINGTGAVRTLNIGNSTFSNGGGIDMSNATLGLTLGANVTTVLQSASQTWTIGNGTTHPAFTDNGQLNNNGWGLAVAGNGTASFGGVISGSGDLWQASSNTTTLSAQNTLSGNVYLSSGTLVLTNAGTAGVGSSLGLGTFGILGGNLNTGASAVTIATNNSVTLYGGFTFVGSNNLNLGTGNVFLGNDATLSITANTVTFGGNITDGYNGTSNAWSSGLSITKTGAGGIALNGTNQFSGNFNMQAGTLTLNSNLSLQNATLNYTGGTISFGTLTNATMGGLAGSTALATPNNFALTLNTNAYDSDNYSAQLSGTNISINIGGNGTQIFSGTNTFTTNATNFVTLNSGTLALNSAAALGAVNATNANLKINGGNLDTTAASTTLNNYLQNWNGDFTYIGTGNLNMGTGGVTLAASRTVTISANTLTVGGVITDGASTFGLTKNGTGTLVLNGANTYNGTTTVNAGTLVLGNALAIGTGGTLTMNGGNLDVNAAITLSANNLENWNADFTFLGSNTLNTGTGAVTMNASRVVTVNASTLTVGGAISGSGFSLTKAGAGTLVLTNGTSSYTGATIINGGTLSVAVLANGGSASSIGSSTNASSNLIINGGTLQYTGAAVTSNRSITVGPNGATLDASGTGALNLNSTSAVAFSSSTAPTNITFTGTNTSTNNFNATIGDAGTGSNVTSVIKNGVGEWVLNGTNTYSGGTTLNAGTLALKNASAIGTGLLTITGGNLDNTNATMTLSGNNTQAWNGSWTFVGTQALNMGTGAVALNANDTLTVTASTLTIGGVISDNGYGYSLSKAGAGTLVLSNANTFSGNMNVSAGTLTLGSNLALQNANLNFTGGTFSFGTLTNATIGGLNGTSALALTNAGATAVALTINTAAATNVTTSTVMSGSGSLIKNGTGAETLTGAQTYSGGTTINAGILSFNGANNFGGGTIVLAGGTLNLNNAQALRGATFNITGGSIDATNGAFANSNTTAQNWNGDFKVIGTNTISMGTAGVTINATRTVDVVASTLTIAGVLTDGAGTFGLTKMGAGNMVLTNTNTYNGSTTINDGTLKLDFATKGNNTVGIVDASSALVLSGGNLNIIGFVGASATNTQTFSGTTIAVGNSSLVGTMATGNAVGLLIKLGTVTRNAGGTLDVTKPVVGNVNGTMTTTGNVVTSAANGIAYMTVGGTDWATTSSGNVIATTTYTNDNIGSLTATTNLRLSAAQTMTAANTTGTLLFNGTAADYTFSTGGFNLTINAGGILMSSAATKNVTISSGNILGQASASDELVIIQNSAATLTIGSNIINNGSNGTIVTKSGAGKLVLNGTNTYSGNTYLNSGTLVVGSTTALGATGSTLNIDGGSLDANSTITLANNNAQKWTNNWTFVGTNDLNMGTGAITMANNTTVTTTAKNLTLGGAISGSGFTLTKNGSGSLILTNGSSTYSGGTVINAGVLEASGNNSLGAAGSNVTVTSGATLQLDNGFDTTGAGVTTGSSNGSLLTIAGVGASSVGALLNAAGNAQATWQGNIALSADATVSSGSGTTGILTLGNTVNPLTSNISLGNHTLTFIGAGTSNITANITGTGGVTVSTSGTVQYIMDGNSYLGTTNVTNGTLLIDTTDSAVPLTTSSGNLLAINGPLVIGDNLGTANTAIVQMGSTVHDNARYTISANQSVTINADGLFYVNGQDQVIGSLTLNGGAIDTTNHNGIGTYGLLGLNGNATILSNSQSAIITGNFNMQNAVGNTTTGFNVASGGNTSGDLIISALLSGGSMVKSGAGNMVLSSNLNTYTGSTEVQAGILNIQADNALGATDGSAAEGTTVSSGAKLQIEGTSVNVGNEQLTLNGNGTSASDSALQSKSGTNSWSGNVVIASNATINTTANSLVLSGTMNTTATSATVTFNGAGTTTVSGPITTGLNVVMNGTGNLVFNGTSVNSYTGTTTVNSGNLELNKSSGTVAVAGSAITINSGGTLLSDASENIGNGVNMVLNGGTWATNASASSITENLNTLTLTATSNLTLGATSNIINFTDSHSNTWAGDNILYINSWNGLLAGGGTDQVYFGTSSAGLGGTSYTGQLGEIIFVNPTIDGVGQSTNFHAVILSTGEVVPFRAAPEASTVFAGAALGGLALLRELRRRKALVAAAKK